MTLKIFITVNIEKNVVDDVYSSLNEFKEVKEVHKIKDGSFELIAMIEVKDLDMYRVFVERLAEVDTIQDFESFITVSST